MSAVNAARRIYGAPSYKRTERMTDPSQWLGYNDELSGWFHNLRMVHGLYHPMPLAGAINTLLHRRGHPILAGDDTAHALVQATYPRYPRPFHAVMGRAMEAYAMSVCMAQDMHKHHLRRMIGDNDAGALPSWRPHFG